MNHQDYLILSSRTAAHEDNIPLSFMHGVVGMISEWVELTAAGDDVNIREECGDFMWYHADGIRAIQRIAMPMVLIPGPEDALEAALGAFNLGDPELCRVSEHLFLQFTGELCDMAKRWTFYGSRPDVDKAVIALNKALSFALLRATAQMRVGAPLGPLSKIREINIAKLLKRFPNKFTEDAALIRDLGIERATMEAMA